MSKIFNNVLCDTSFFSLLCHHDQKFSICQYLLNAVCIPLPDKEMTRFFEDSTSLGWHGGESGLIMGLQDLQQRERQKSTTLCKVWIQGQAENSSTAFESNVTGPRSRNQLRGGFRTECKGSLIAPVASP